MSRAKDWPDARAYREAVVAETVTGYVASLGEVVRTVSGEPESHGDDGSTTLRFRKDRRDVAVRFFTTEEPDRRSRYAAIADFSRYVFNGALPRTRYVPRGIRIDDAWWPVVTTDWVDVPTLRDEVLARLGDRDAMLRLARDVREAVRSFEILGIAHGDLSSSSIVRTKGRLQFVGSDAAFVPALCGASMRSFGHCDYQHRDRRYAAFDARLDRFASLVIYTALVALAERPELWPRFDTGENLLFVAEDFRSEGTSDIFGLLLEHDATSGLGLALRHACRVPVEQVPSLESVVDASRQRGSVVATLVRAQEPEPVFMDEADAVAQVLASLGPENAFVERGGRGLFRRFTRPVTSFE